MEIGLLKEPYFEKRVAMPPNIVQKLVKQGHSVGVEFGSGERAFTSDALYTNAGAVCQSRDGIFQKTDLLISIHPFAPQEIDLLQSHQIIVGVYNPLVNNDLVDLFLKRNLTLLSLDMLPRTTRAQSMDILSSMATVAGYKSVLAAAVRLPRFFPMFMTAAGTIKPARVLILGAGVAGLQAIGVARKLGAIVEVFDVRSAVKEEVQSLGAKFIEVEGALDDSAAGGYAVEQTDDFKARQQQMIQEHAMKADVVITTAQIPGRPAPKLIVADTINRMKPGSVIVDLASSSGGNTELTQDNEEVVHNGVTIIGNSLLQAELPIDASVMFGNNLYNFLQILFDEKGVLQLNFDDDIIAACTVAHQGKIISKRVSDFYKK